jgi:hypothetical protein
MTTLPLADAVKNGLLASGWYANRLERDAFPGVLTLCYHGVRKSAAEDSLPFPDLHVVVDTFESHCRMIAETCHPIDLATFCDAHANGRALPERPVVGIIGDGSALYTFQALWTAAHYRIPVIWVILNNTSYRILKQRLHAMRGHAEQTDTYVGMELLDPAIDFVALARSFGVEAARARTVHEATDLIAQGVKGNSPLLIDVELDRAFKPM